MPRYLLRLAPVIVALGYASAVAAQPPAAETLPAPRPAPLMPVPGPAYSPLMQSVAPPYAFYSYPRRSAYEVWHYYDVDRYGFYRPRVQFSSWGSYYLYNGKPFPATVHPLEYMPYAAD